MRTLPNSLPIVRRWSDTAAIVQRQVLRRLLGTPATPANCSVENYCLGFVTNRPKMTGTSRTPMLRNSKAGSFRRAYGH